MAGVAVRAVMVTWVVMVSVEARVWMRVSAAVLYHRRYRPGAG